MSAKGQSAAGGAGGPAAAWDASPYVYRPRRGKTDWAGLGAGDAFKPNLDYFLRVAAQRLFYAACGRSQRVAARLAGLDAGSDYKPKTKPQLGPCYTTYPCALAAHAAIGLTGFLEFQAVAGSEILAAHLDEYLKNPAAADGLPVDPAACQKLARIVVRTVQTRLLLEDLARAPALASVEFYRLFAASQQAQAFAAVPEIVQAVVLYGDILPDWEGRELHPLTRAMLGALQAASDPYFARLPRARPQDLLTLGAAWARELCRCLAAFLPPPRPPEGPLPGPAPAAAAGGSRPAPGSLAPPGRAPAGGRIAPLDGPNPPALFAPPTAAERAAEALLGGGRPGESEGPAPDRSAAAQALKSFAEALDGAGGQKGRWEDMRSDLVERAMAASAFSESPIQGTPTDGHDVKVPLGGEQVGGGEIHDRPVELSDDSAALDALAAEARPIAEALRQALYPNVEELVETERLRPTGALDPARLAMADCSAAVFRRHRIRERADRHGQPLLLIACDGSGSLNPAQMRMVKVLAAAWLGSTARSRVQVMAGLYHSGEIRRGVTGPLVQWIYHPRKTPATGRRDALRAVAALPGTGTGVQSDALSLAFMLGEAARLARGRRIYLILVSDCQWNRSFGPGRSGCDEVRAVFENARRDLGDALHTTLVALGVEGETGFEDLLDKVIAVPAEGLADCAAMAGRIGLYVASCMKERRRFIVNR